ncbi:sensor histidine kinase [Paenibacillus sp. strain BS8-2]
MRLKINTYTKILFIIIPLVLCIVVMYFYSHQRSVQFIKKELTKSSQDGSAFFLQQIDTTFDQITTSSITLSRDPTVMEMMNSYLFKTYYNQAKIENDLWSKLILQQSSTNWSSTVSVFFSELRTVVSTNSSYITYDEQYLHNHFAANWEYREVNGTGEFYRQIGYPSSGEDQISQAVVETSIDARNLSNLLSQLKAKGNGVHFLTDGQQIIGSLSPEWGHIQSIMNTLETPTADSGHLTIRIESNDYIVFYAKSKTLGWYLISSVPVSEFLNPIIWDQKLFYGFVSFFLVLGIIAIMLLYRNVQMPLKQLIRNTQQVNKDEALLYSAAGSINEFQFLNRNFEKLATNVLDLTDKVFVETIRSREAMLKQLQSQINPHFLYNSLSFIINMTKLNQEKEVIAMAHHLSDYFRYTTRVDNQTPTVREEISLVSHYLEIQAMRNKRLEYELDISDSLLDLHLPRLIVQPLVENAIIHGIEHRIGSSFIRVVGGVHNDECFIRVEDNGVSISDALLDEISGRMNAPNDPESSGGCGLQNVHLRMKLRLGDDAGVRLEAADPVGMIATLYWRSGHVPDSNR